MSTFRDQIRVAFDPKWRAQTAIGTARAEADLTASLTATAITPSRDERKKIFYDCSGQVMRRQEMTARLRKLTLEMDGPGAKTMTGFLAFAAGVTLTPTGTDPKVQPIQLLPKPSRNIPVFTLRIGHEDGTSVGSIWKDCIVAKALARAAAGDDSTWKLTVDILANYSTTAGAAATWPACIDETPLKLYDGSLIIDGTERKLQTRSVSMVLDNRPPTGRTPFVAGSLDVARWFRAARRDYGITAAIEGVEDPTNATFLLLFANNGVGTEVANTLLRIGPATECFTCNVPKADWGPADQAQGYDGDADAEEAVLNSLIMPKDVSGSAAAPVNFTGTMPAAQLTQQMLLTS